MHTVALITSSFYKAVHVSWIIEPRGIARYCNRYMYVQVYFMYLFSETQYGWDSGVDMRIWNSLKIKCIYTWISTILWNCQQIHEIYISLTISGYIYPGSKIQYLKINMCVYTWMTHVYTWIKFVFTHFPLRPADIMFKNTYRLESDKTDKSQSIHLGIALQMYVHVVRMYFTVESSPEHLPDVFGGKKHMKDYHSFFAYCSSADLNNIYILLLGISFWM